MLACQELKGKLTVKFPPLRVGGTVDGVQVDSNTILLTTGAQNVAGLVTVSVPGQDKVVFVEQNLEVQDKKFNSISLDKLYEDTVGSFYFCSLQKSMIEVSTLMHETTPTGSC